MIKTKEEFFKEAPDHLVKAVKEGKAAFFDGEVYTLATLGVDTANLVEGSVDNVVKLYEQEARIAELESQLAQAKKDGSESVDSGTHKALQASVDALLTEHESLKQTAAGLQADVKSAERARDAEKARADRLTAEVEGGRITIDQSPLVNLVEALIPDSKTGLERLPVDALQKVAEYRGLDTKDKDKAALVADLLPKGGN